MRPITAKEVVAYREMHSVGIREALYALQKKRLLSAISDAKSKEDLKEILSYITTKFL